MLDGSDVNDAKTPMIWQDFACGEYIESELNLALKSWWPRLFGYHLLKLGPLSSAINSLHCQINYHFSLYQDSKASIYASPKHLPIQQNCIDAVLMTALLEYESDPYQILREVDRVIVSGGYVIIAGFNPISPAFFGKLMPEYQSELPWSGHFYMPSRVKDWLGLLGYQVLTDERLVYHHLLTQCPSKFGWHNRLQNWLPSTGGMYLIVARKLDSPYTLIRDKQKIKAPNWSTAPSAGRSGLKVK